MKSDHTHICCVCRKQWPCRNYTLRECLAKGVYKAAQVNRAGPYCDECRQKEMRKRQRRVDRYNRSHGR